jgi:hypothetical protein
MQIGLKEVGALSFFFNCLSAFAIRTVQDFLEGLKLNGIHQVLIYTHKDNLLVENQITKKKDTKAL